MNMHGRRGNVFLCVDHLRDRPRRSRGPIGSFSVTVSADVSSKDRKVEHATTRARRAKDELRFRASRWLCRFPTYVLDLCVDLLAHGESRSVGAWREPCRLRGRRHCLQPVSQERLMRQRPGLCHPDRARRGERRRHDNAVRRHVTLGYPTPALAAARHEDPGACQATGWGVEAAHGGALQPGTPPSRKGQDAASKGG